VHITDTKFEFRGKGFFKRKLEASSKHMHEKGAKFSWEVLALHYLNINNAIHI